MFSPADALFPVEEQRGYHEAAPFSLSDGAGLTDAARRLIGGYLSHAASLTAFGNTVPVSFLRLVPHQEAPTAICWGDRNRSVLVRVPLGWQGLDDRMFRDANPGAEPVGALPDDSQTVELRSPDGSAAVHLLLAGMTVAARIGLSDPDMAGYADERYVSGDASRVDGLDQLPASCAQAAARLLAQREDYEALGVFPPALIDSWAAGLLALGDADLREEIADTRVQVEDLVTRYFHVG